MNQNMCYNCGGEIISRGGRFVCSSCGSYMPEQISGEEVSLLYAAFQKLRLADFYEAEREFDDIIRRHPQNAQAYWGRLMSRYGIKYERDYDGRNIPTCYATSIDSVYESYDYRKAMELADAETRAVFKDHADYMERVRKEWLDKASREKPYDIFISFKDSDQEEQKNGREHTVDSDYLRELYLYLMKKGYRVFFSRESLEDKGGEKYEPYIYAALSTAKVMLVYGSKPEYINATWVKNEWTRYQKRIRSGEKHPDSLIVAYKGFSPKDLPLELSESGRQHLDASKPSFYNELIEIIEQKSFCCVIIYFIAWQRFRAKRYHRQFFSIFKIKLFCGLVMQEIVFVHSDAPFFRIFTLYYIKDKVSRKNNKSIYEKSKMCYNISNFTKELLLWKINCSHYLKMMPLLHPSNLLKCLKKRLAI